MKSAVQLYNMNDLYSIMLVKTAHKKYPRFLLREETLEHGQWASATAEIEGVKLMATRFVDLKEKMFIATCSTYLAGPPRETKHHGLVPRPMNAFTYLEGSPSIDIHNHFRTGSSGLEDVWKTKNPVHRQIAGVLCFLLTNAYLAKLYFQYEEFYFQNEVGKHTCKVYRGIQANEEAIARCTSGGCKFNSACSKATQQRKPLSEELFLLSTQPSCKTQKVEDKLLL